MTWPAVLSWVLIAIFTLPRSPVPLVYLFFSLGAFSSLTLDPGDTGVNILPQAVCAVFLVSKMLLTGDRLPRAIDAAIDPLKLNLLFLFLVYALFTAYVMPRLFARMVEVIPLNSATNWPVVLTPISANINQSAYMILSVGTVLAFFLEGQSNSFRRHFVQSLVLASLVLIATGIADIMLSSAGLADLLLPFRNAKYSLLIDAYIVGEKRFVGLMPEASAYGSACVTAAAFLAFPRPCLENRIWRERLVPLVIAALLAMAVGSKSSTAYGGLAVFGAVYAANWLRRAWSENAPAREGLRWEAAAAVAAIVAFLGVAALIPDLLDPIYERIDTLILRKSETSSYSDRSRMTMSALHAFFFTYGLGVGLGSAMSSNWFVAILSNTGILGAALLFGFILRLYFLRCRSSDPRTKEFVIGLKCAFLPLFSMMAVAGTTPDLGAWLASGLGLLASLTSPEAQFFVQSAVAPRQQLRARSRS